MAREIRPLLRRARTVFSRLREKRETTTSFEEGNVEQSTVQETKGEQPAPNADGEQSESDGEHIDAHDQHGIRDVEAITMTWSRNTLIFVFINMWFLYFVNAFQSSVYDSLSSYVASSFSQHSLSGVPSAMADAFAAATYLPVGKMMDVWGRAEGFLFMTICATLGLILMASCNSFPIYCAANVFYYVGFYGMEYCVDVITADSSTLKNRGLAYAFTSSPYIITAFAGPKVADEFYYRVGWRWGFGAWAIIFPVVAAPLYIVLKLNLKKAEKEGHRMKEPSGRTFMQSVWFWVNEFDLVGVIIFTIGLVLFELPFDIASEAPNGWGTGYIIAMLVVGFSMLFFFAIWETWVAPTPLFDYRLLTNRTVLGACLLDATYQISYYCWYNYYQNFLQVVNDMSITTSGYVMNIFDIVSGVLLLLVGYIIRRTGRFRWTLYISVPLYVFTQGLMIYFRKPNSSVGYQIMCQIFISIGGSIFIIVEQLGILAAVDHQHVATALALLNVIGTIGDSAGYTICTAIWTNTFKKALAHYLPEDAMGDLDSIYNSVDVQISYAPGTAIRTAIQHAYAYSEVRLLAAGLGIMSLAFVWMFMIKDIDLNKVKQTKGMVF
ncbi:uncharacterized protein N7483_005326 [Penicillium malachiteum]|uniref:uncharacterized protein n=1 Tax=Penicillium malachiteum TaxID=1324776 RepID=UPI00254834EF|nr:uncharacterized protein N7483_005326 [Penicillium malachiteum]KAJ5730818.1 hypothetical protein N7483_005326 [Penicillium malachiteum]